MCFPGLFAPLAGLFGGGGAAAAGSGLTTGLQLAGAGLSAIGTVASASAQSQGLKAQAAFNERQAMMEEQRTAYEVQRERENAQRLMARQRAGYLSSGLALEGTPTAVIADTASEAALDIAAIQYGGQVRGSNLRTQAQIDRANASAARTAGFIGAGSSLLSGIAKTRLSNPYAIG